MNKPTADEYWSEVKNHPYLPIEYTTSPSSFNDDFEKMEQYLKRKRDLLIKQETSR